MEIHISGNNSINGSAIGERNTVINNTGDINWEKLQECWLELLSRLPGDSKEYDGSAKALKHVLNKDKSGLLKCIKTYGASFSSSLFANVASPFVLSFIHSLL